MAVGDVHNESVPPSHPIAAGRIQAEGKLPDAQGAACATTPQIPKEALVAANVDWMARPARAELLMLPLSHTAFKEGRSTSTLCEKEAKVPHRRHGMALWRKIVRLCGSGVK